MARINSFTCDSCGALKKNMNGWFMYRSRTGFFEAFSWQEDQNHMTQIDLKHACSMSCLAKELQKSLFPGTSDDVTKTNT